MPTAHKRQNACYMINGLVSELEIKIINDILMRK